MKITRRRPSLTRSTNAGAGPAASGTPAAAPALSASTVRPAAKFQLGSIDPAAFDQTQSRARRREWRRVHYTGSNFNLKTEVGEILTPLSKSATRLPRPLALRREIDDVADAVHEVVSTVVGMLAESRHPDASAIAQQMTRDLAARPTAPDITDEQLCDGSWAAKLIRYAGPLTKELAALLDRAKPPGTTEFSASERLERALRELDQAALALERKIPKAAEAQARPTFNEFQAGQKARREAERIERRLSKMQRAVGAR